MSKTTRITIFALILLAVLFSLPFWLPKALAAVQVSKEPAAEAAAILDVSNIANGSAPVIASPLLAQSTDPVFVWDGGVYVGSNVQTMDTPPQVMAWVPSTGAPLWAHETGFSYGGLYDAASGRIYLMEQRNANSQSLEGVQIPNSGISPSPEWPLFLTVLDAASGETLSATQVSGRFFNSATSGAARPLALRSSNLYLMNYGAIDNLAIYDLETNTLSEEKWDLCADGYPTQVHVSADSNSVISLCIDYSTSEMAGSISQLSLADGSVRSLELGVLGEESYMGGNGLVLSNGDLAYALDSDAMVILEINLQTMQIVRKANYADELAAFQPSLGERFTAWLLRQAATPAAAKRMFAVTAVSPDGKTLAVSGPMGDSYSTRSIYLIDLESLQARRELKTAATPAALLFRGNEVLLSFYERSGFNNPLGGVVFDLKSEAYDAISLPINGYLNEILATN
jgi:hypothetical protein